MPESKVGFTLLIKNTMTVKLHSDRAYMKDVLGFKPYADLLAEMVMNTAVLPFTTGIFGDWGSGKTTLMRMVQNQVGPECQTIWFNARKYDDNQDLFESLLRLVFDKIIGSDGVNGEGGIEQAITQYVGEKGRLIIFIDDLDRCMPEHVMNLLEAIPLHLEQERCVIVLGANRGILDTMLVQRYRKLKMSGRACFEKLVQFSFTIPPADSARLLKYLYRLSLPTNETFNNAKQIAEMIVFGAARNMRRLKRLVNQLRFLIVMAKLSSVTLPPAAVLTKLLVLQSCFPAFFAIVERYPEAIQLVHQFLAATDPVKRQSVLERLPLLEEFVENDPFLDFFRSSAQVTCQDTTQVEQLMQLVVMVR